MKKLITFLLIVCTGLVNAQITTLWQKSAAGSTLPTWFSSTGSTERGFAYGYVDGNNRLYVVSRNGGNSIKIINADDGSDVGTLDITSISGGTYSISDVGVSSDGVIFVCNLTTNASTSAFKVYKWTSEASAPTLVISYNDAEVIRLGDKFSVTGSTTDNSLTIYASNASGGSAKVIKFTTTDNATTFSATTISGPSIGGSASAYPKTTGSSDFYYNATGINPKKYQSDGTLLGTVPGGIIETGSNAIVYLGKFVEDEVIATFIYSNSTAKIAKIPNGVLANATLFTTTPTLGGNSNPNGVGDIDFKLDSDGTITLFVLATNNGFGAYKLQLSPILDGSFDGTVYWGSAKDAADGLAGWANANVTNIYSTYDDTYLYLGAEITASNWMSWAFIINSKSGGTSTDSWSRDITYTHTNLPDYAVRGNFNDGWTEINIWNGSSWTGTSADIGTTEHNDNITGTDITGFVEVRIPHVLIPEGIGDIQFFITGDQNSHGSFDACPNDDNSTDWSGAAAHSDLTNYTLNVALPVQLTSFTAAANENGVVLNWTTATEVNNYGFEILRSVQNDWEKIGFVQGHGNSNSPNDYTFTDADVSNGSYTYRLKQIDYDGTFTYTDEVSVDVNLALGKLSLDVYPNPFNPSTTLGFVLPKASRVNLTVYDITGQKVAELIENEMMEAGYHRHVFNAGGLASGIYISVLQAEGIQIVKKLQLLK